MSSLFQPRALLVLARLRDFGFVAALAQLRRNYRQQSPDPTHFFSGDEEDVIADLEVSLGTAFTVDDEVGAGADPVQLVPRAFREGREGVEKVLAPPGGSIDGSTS